MRKPVIYLAGFICDGPEWAKCKEWRNWYKEKRPNYIWIDPMDGEPKKDMKDHGLQSAIPANAIVSRDLASVKNSDIILANTDNFGNERPIIGTVFEMAWSGLLLKPLLVLSKDHWYVKHPFVTQAASHISEDREDILRVLDYIVRGI